jgi:NAD(P)-dependent dehydrogenase (short-subunit alcohol dehydrogenase family)
MGRRLEGKVAIVTGASSGIGEAAAIRFANEGAKVVLAARREEEGEAVTERIRSEGGDATFIRTDVSQWSDVEAMVAHALSEYGALHYAFNNAGKSARGTDKWLELTEESWDEMIDINLKGVWMCMRHQIPAMIESGGGAIVNNSSIIGVRSSGSAPYSASKSGVIGLTKSAAIQFADRGVRVNAVAPGWIMTPIVENRLKDNPQLLEDVRSGLAIGREGQSDEIASVAAWLCSDESSYVTGECIAADGGFLAQLGTLR